MVTHCECLVRIMLRSCCWRDILLDPPRCMRHFPLNRRPALLSSPPSNPRPARRPPTAEFPLTLLHVSVSPASEMNSDAQRQMAAYVLKNYVDTHWNSKAEKFDASEETPTEVCSFPFDNPPYSHVSIYYNNPSQLYTRPCPTHNTCASPISAPSFRSTGQGPAPSDLARAWSRGTISQDSLGSGVRGRQGGTF